MAQPARRPTLQQRVSAAILDGAAQVFAVQGEQASMDDIAAATGVARATVYRYFPSREVLLDDLTRVAVNDIDARLASARIEEVEPEEGIARAVRALVDVGDAFVLLARWRHRSDAERFEARIIGPLRRLFERGQAAGGLRDDIKSDRMVESLIALIVGLVTSTPALGREDATATVTSLFLDGARARGPRRR